jgi:parallel beta helix pectate lyase-like protein
MRVKTTLVAAVSAGLMTMLLSGPAAADVIKVSPGESIQDPINQAQTGDTVKLAPGTYQESVQIKTDGLTLKGSGADETVIEPGATPPVDPICSSFFGIGGICVSDTTLPPDPNGQPTVNNRVANVRIKGLRIQNFQGAGIFFFGTRDQRVSDVVAENNAEYGIAAFNTTRGQYWDNVTNGNREAGIYVGDSENADALVRDNVSNANRGFGIFIRDASHGLVEDNETLDNCIGILFLDTPSPDPNGDWIAHDNTANHNNAACSGEEGPSSGLGIVIDSAHRITLLDNTANGNQPSGPTPGSGGIVVLTEPVPGFPAATDNVIKDNTAFGNLPVDLFWDQSPGNTFDGNRCKTSDPEGLCEQGRHADGRGGDDDDDDHGHHGHRGHRGKHRHDGDHGHKHHKHHKHGHERD